MAGNMRAIGLVDGVFDAIVSAMRTHSDVALVQWAACGALKGLAVSDGVLRMWLVRAHAVSKLWH